MRQLPLTRRVQDIESWPLNQALPLRTPTLNSHLNCASRRRSSNLGALPDEKVTQTAKFTMRSFARTLSLLIYTLGFGLALVTSSAPILMGQTGDIASKVYQDASPSVFLISVRDSTGSPVSIATAFLIKTNLLITNLHAVTGGTVYLEQGGLRVPGTIEARDPANDLALIKVNIDISAKPLSFAANAPSVGDTVMIISNPEGLERSLTTGIVSGVRELNARKLLQITAPIAPGSSGGPVLNSRSEAIGVTVSTIRDGQNLNFAIPVSEVRNLLMLASVSGPASFQSLMEQIGALHTAERKLKFSAEPTSEYQQVQQQILSIMKAALIQSFGDPERLLQVARKASTEANYDIEVEASEKSVQLQPSAEAYALEGEGLTLKCLLAENSDKKALQAQAAKALQAAIRLSKSPEANVYLELAGVLEDMELFREAQANYYRAFDVSSRQLNLNIKYNSLRGLFRNRV